MNDSLGAILAIVVLWAILRFAFGGSSPISSSANGPTLNTARARQVPQHMIDSVKTLFPHIPDASISYDLQRSNSVEATCERILNEGGLPTPPAGFFGTDDRSPTMNANTHTPAPARPVVVASPPVTPNKSPNLIARYGLQSKITSAESPTSDSSPSTANGWATTASERARILRDRKEKLILEARLKLQTSLTNSTNTTTEATVPQ